MKRRWKNTCSRTRKRIEEVVYRIVCVNWMCNLVQRRSSTQDRIDFLLRDSFHPIIPILGRCLPILLVDVCTRTRPATIFPHWRLKFLEEIRKRPLELFGCSGVRMLHTGYGWPGPFAQKTDERTVCSSQPCCWVHVTRTVVYICLQRFTNPRPRQCYLPLPAAAKTERVLL